jgi:hypothetical protein
MRPVAAFLLAQVFHPVADGLKEKNIFRAA